jgi:hypothetical protein
MRLEIRPFPTQRQRKEIKGLRQVTGVETNGNQAWVTHDAYSPGSIVHGLNAIGFRVKGYDPSWDIEARNRSRIKAMKKAKKRRK